MAKKTKIEESTDEVKKKPSALGFMKALSKETGSESFADSKLTSIETYISTGNYALNRIISGSIYKGLPEGIIATFGGDSASMKTVLAFRIAANAIKENGYDCIIYVDSEGGSNRGMLENVGLDPSIVQYIPVSNIEECTIKLIQTYKTIEKYQQETDPNFRALIILDSLGGLVSEKAILDAEKDKTTGDLGSSAKAISKTIRAVTMPALKTRCGMLMISQTYDNPGALFKSKLMNFRGGKAVMYQTSLVVQLSRRLEKGVEKEDNFYEDSVITAFTVKTRNNVRPFLETEMKLSFKNGFNGYEYYGILPEAIRLGFIQNPKVGWYTVPTAGEKQYRLKDLIGGPEAKKIWDTFIDEFDKASAEDISYKSLTDNNMSETEKQLKEELATKFNITFGDSEEVEQEEENE